MDEQPFIMDIKLDGERLAIHIDNTLVSTTNTNTTSNTNTNNTSNSSSYHSTNSNSNSNSCSSGGNNDSSSKYASPVLMYTRRRNDYSEHYAPLGEIVRESVAVMTGTLSFLRFFLLFICLLQNFARDIYFRP